MRHLWLVVVLAGSGCNQLLGIGGLEGTDGGPAITSDSTVSEIDGSMPDAPPSSVCFGTATLAESCFVPSTAPDVTLGGPLNTSPSAADVRCKSTTQGADACVIIGNEIRISADLNVTGSRPLMIVAATVLAIDGDLEVGSTEGGRTGPGANPTVCVLGSPGGNSSNDGAGGGAGGSFGGRGADGGIGADGGGAGGVASPVSIGMGLRGGCPGSRGGTVGNDSGPGGNGGGALYLVAGTSITISRHVRAHGGGGTGGIGSGSGGGGGGSGGMIALQAPTITLTGPAAELLANGGGGGEGSVSNSSNDGADGAQSTAFNEPAPGGTGAFGPAGDGGNGATGTVAAEKGKNGTSGTGGMNPPDGGGGGGGGGVGLIWVKGTLIGDGAARISPAATIAP